MGLETETYSGVLRREAEALLEASGLIGLLAGQFGEASATGSYAYDLMAWRDIDIHAAVPPSARLRWAGMLAELGAAFERAGARLHRAEYLDDYVDPHPLGAGLYWGLRVVAAGGAGWKLDLWGWSPEDFRFRQARDAALQRRLASADRGLILRLKAAALARPGCYGQRVLSMDVYRFVIERAGSDIDALEAWAAASRRDPAASPPAARGGPVS